ncbi:MAG: hypothetical protein GKR77_06740, partial [Legionellales bacterium]|nr:hypothetical protein [Legionellales bacterium]
MMTFQLIADPNHRLQIIAFELSNDGLSAHYQWQLALRCRHNPSRWLRQWGRVTMSNRFGQRHWHGCITRQSEYGCCQGWHYWLIVLASPLAVLARWVTSRTWVSASAILILRQTLEHVGWREGVDFVFAVDNPAT